MAWCVAVVVPSPSVISADMCATELDVVFSGGGWHLGNHQSVTCCGSCVAWVLQMRQVG